MFVLVKKFKQFEQDPTGVDAMVIHDDEFTESDAATVEDNTRDALHCIADFLLDDNIISVTLFDNNSNKCWEIRT